MPDTAPHESYIRIDGDVKRGVILLADHARNALPVRYGTLGLEPSQFSRHIAYDIGVEQVAAGLARALGCPALLTAFSRLLIDANRQARCRHSCLFTASRRGGVGLRGPGRWACCGTRIAAPPTC